MVLVFKERFFTGFNCKHGCTRLMDLMLNNGYLKWLLDIFPLDCLCVNVDEPGSVWLKKKGVLVSKALRLEALRRAADGWWCSGYWCSLPPAAIRHTLMIVSHLLPGRPATSAALSSKTGSSAQILSPWQLAEKPGDRLCCEPLCHQFFTPLFFHRLSSPLFTFKAPTDCFLISLHRLLPSPLIHLVFLVEKSAPRWYFLFVFCHRPLFLSYWCGFKGAMRSQYVSSYFTSSFSLIIKCGALIAPRPSPVWGLRSGSATLQHSWSRSV